MDDAGMTPRDARRAPPLREEQRSSRQKQAKAEVPESALSRQLLESLTQIVVDLFEHAGQIRVLEPLVLYLDPD
jgi:hypothetical protein